MSRVLMVSIVLGVLLVPVMAASDRNPVRGFRRAVLGAVITNAIYLFAVLFIYPRLG